jgi:DNA polymerase-3 subunit gamma/tau
MYQVLARKWRPRTLDELVGQAHVARTLKNAIESNRLAHAYVFAGLRGTGKTSVARILAKCLNCEKGPATTPCDRCVSCQEITEGRSMDVLELDAASRTGVDNIRELQEIVSYAPVRDRYKILIIDEAHMLSKAAFNALLKTLEEPPPQVVFILATTEIQKLLPTILSRCQVFEFHRIALKSIAAHLRAIATSEGIVISDRTLEMIARAGEGSVRDSLSVLERVLAFCGTNVDDAEALHVLGAVRTEVLVDFVRGIAARDAAALLASLDGLVGEGHDLIHFWGELVAVVRDLMLVRAWPGGRDALSRSPDEIAALAEAGGALSLEDWTRVFQILAALEYGLKSSSQPRFLFEGALVRLAGLGAVTPIEQLLAMLPETPAVAGPAAPPKTKLAAAPPPVPFSPSVPAPARSTVTEGLADVRTALIGAVTAARPMLGALLERTSTVAIDGGALVIGFGVSDTGMRRMLVSGDNLRSIEQVAAKTFGRSLTVKVLEQDERDAAPSRSPAPAEAASAAKGESPQELNERARKDPVVRRLISEFGASVVDVRPVGPGGGEASDATQEENG